MPLYEYSCKACGNAFGALVRGSQAPACPACGGRSLERRFPAPTVHSQGTHAKALKAAKKRDARQADARNRAQREYEAHHDD
ncbi:MAG: zinc ribbon domain-containing protein [Gemmatimonadetes bacterium]|nr:zinc ribbon domain-containing protein [Gemmatimonadota bacterium]